ncbi:unnamed protein product [Parnassius apollo]|uniref:(apollo) hypothetical protein n=1 Tax=Parnassius apollo TaxID=110799 RepID=A0A8S3WNQ8_PARAO|nr:unnamed protein product [Parnassius apollo]
MAGDAAPQATDQHPYVEAAMDLPVVVGSDNDEIVSHELEQMRSILEEVILVTHNMPLENPLLDSILNSFWLTQFFLAPQWQFAVLLASNFQWLNALLDKVAPSQPGENESRTVSQRGGPLSAD